MDKLDLQQLELLVYLFAGLIVLVLVGLVVYVVVSVRRRNAEASAALRDLDELVIRPSLLVVGQVLALVRDKAGEPIKVEIEGTKYTNFSQIQDPQIKRQVVDVALELIQFTGVVGEDVPLTPRRETGNWREELREGSHSALEKTRTPHPSKQPQSPPPPASAEVEERFLGLLSEMGQDRPQPQRPSLTSSLQRTLKRRRLEPDATRSFVHDIEDIVQRRVQLIPALVGRGLHVQPGPEGKVLFVFEGQEYESVDDVPNFTARQVIKDAIQEWDELT